MLGDELEALVASGGRLAGALLAAGSVRRAACEPPATEATGQDAASRPAGVCGSGDLAVVPTLVYSVGP
jgi:hypothetical protein